MSNDLRQELVKLIHEEGMTIREAASTLGIPYPNAKAVNKIYENEWWT